MTCIVGLIHEGKVYIGGDSAGVSSYDVTVRKDKKVFHNGPMVFGFTTSFRMGQLLQYSLTIPERNDKDIMAYMVTDFIDAVRKCLKDGGVVEIEKSVEECGVFLVGYEGRLFQIDSDFQVGESHKPYESVGCGERYALGAIHNSHHLLPDARVINALETAAAFSAGVCGPFHLVSN